ncbi:hybrid sensor histidine kinase/response regulator [Rhodoplanes sp. Z2-YC6860]|uniref:hybrid sensor histidine kinase/response regulator n=1 Tax=Rhodoplanes sp. Z2-YC6860 TaxID=674703 RepID=UPI00078E86D8|nr:hybrid sensor histidine kinase/response regulator [Rhodoplanes sp. Z2-YC6860]AMN44761.1 two-component hybrid sensor histidine kinase and response regulator [Rhodoplanes sp. Z2-YC6860]
MLQGWVVIAVALGYIGLLFLVASYGDRARRFGRHSRARLWIYPLSLAIYCTSWTFFGSVGSASRSGYEFLTIYIGPVLMIGLFAPLIGRVVRLAKAQNITSIADFIAARYGKSQAVAATVALIAIVGTVPYIALQLKAVSFSLETIIAHVMPNEAARPLLGDMALFVALSMAVFAVLFGTRHIDATEHQDGLMLAVATESIVKLVTFLAVGTFVTFWMFDGPMALFGKAMQSLPAASVLTREPAAGPWIASTLLSFIAILLLPRQFHVAVVENNDEREIKRARWMFPIYLVLINLFVVPIAIAGLLTFPAGNVDGDMFVLALPLSAGSNLFTILAFVGGLSAATAMVIVESVALAIMVSNDIVIPWVLQRRQTLIEGSEDVGALLLTVRRLAIFAILLFAYFYHRSAGDSQLAAIGILAFAAIAQLAPAFFGGLVWRNATAGGAIAGMTIGILTWAYTLLLPTFWDNTFLAQGPWGIELLRPQHLFGLDLPPLVHGVVWSLALNFLTYIGFSIRRAPRPIERMQADVFVPTRLAPMAPGFRLWRSSVTVGDLTSTVARYLGEDRTRSSFESFAVTRRISLQPQVEADVQLLRYAEHQLASAIGAASSRLVLSLLLRKRTVSTEAALKLLDDANAAIHYNREILQTALDHVRQGIAVYDKEMRLVCWNRQFGEILNLPPELTRVGANLEEIVRYNAEQGALGPGDIETLVRARLEQYASTDEPYLKRFIDRGLVVEIRTNRMPDGGIVTTATDITPSVVAAEALERANATLEMRVRERTGELTRLNAELGRAKAEADEANISKTRFVAAASHDILQPLNAARLYVTSLMERRDKGDDARLVENLDASLDSVEEIFSALLDISRLDTGAMRPELVSFRIDELLRQLEVEFAPLAHEKGLKLKFMPCRLAIRSDRRLLRRLLQNFISNAIKYTPKGHVLIGCRRRGSNLRIDVYDTGLGIPASKRRVVFREFQRLDEGAKVARGLGLGLSIVERIGRVLDHKVDLLSVPRRGSRFSVTVPVSSAAPVQAQRETAAPDRGQLSGVTVLCIDNEPKVLDGMETLLGGWGCRVLKAPDLATAITATEAAADPLHGLLVDYHLDRGTGLAAIAELRQRFGANLPAILITADRSPLVRDLAREKDVQILNKPLKPAALRALMAQWRVQRIAAAE